MLAKTWSEAYRRPTDANSSQEPGHPLTRVSSHLLGDWMPRRLQKQKRVLCVRRKMVQVIAKTKRNLLAKSWAVNKAAAAMI